MSEKTIVALITRPLQDAKKTELALNDIGMSGFIEPFINIYYNGKAPQLIKPHLDDCQAIVTTSANAIRAIGHVEKPLVVVGNNSADVAKNNGYKQIHNAGGNVTALEKYIEENFYPANGKLLYASADVISRDLKPAGFDIERVVVYKTKPIQEISAPCKDLLKHKSFACVLFFSKRAADIFASLTKKYSFDDTYAFCISDNIAKSLKKAGFKDIIVSEKPNSESLLELIRDFKFN